MGHGTARQISINPSTGRRSVPQYSHIGVGASAGLTCAPRIPHSDSNDAPRQDYSSQILDVSAGEHQVIPRLADITAGRTSAPQFSSDSAVHGQHGCSLQFPDSHAGRGGAEQFSNVGNPADRRVRFNIPTEPYTSPEEIHQDTRLDPELTAWQQRLDRLRTDVPESRVDNRLRNNLSETHFNTNTNSTIRELNHRESNSENCANREPQISFNSCIDPTTRIAIAFEKA